MKYYYKLKKYSDKLILYGGLTKKLPNQSLDMEIYFILNGGTPIEILSLITNEFKKIKDNKYVLGLRSIQSGNNNYRFIKHNYVDKSIEYPPALNSGGLSAIYELKNESNKEDSTKYILRVFHRKPTYYTESNVYHMCDKKKIKEEYELFNKYMIDIYHYGILKVHETGKARPTSIDYLITKLYKTSATDNVSQYTKQNKLKLLRNNIEMILELRKNNYFLGDYKLSNIGWDDDFNVFLIDYDSDTIIKIDEKMLILNKPISGMTKLAFTYTYIPNYLTVNKKYFSSDVNNLEITKYDKYCTGGLIKIIQQLELDVDLVDEFKLNDPVYENILTYEQMLAKIELFNN